LIASKQFTVIYADNPWEFDNKAARGSVERGGNYKSTMSVEEMAAMGALVKHHAADNALLFLWCPIAFILNGSGVAVARAWGFEPKQMFAWVKMTNDMEKPRFITGNYFRGAFEPAIVCTRGRATPLIKNKGLPNVLHAPWGKKHSEKPEGVQDMLDKLIPDGPRVEFFARRFRPGWSCLGNELPDGGSLERAPGASCSTAAWALLGWSAGELLHAGRSGDG
jgi:N6-adenosine-specific RNA methylase IME4